MMREELNAAWELRRLKTMLDNQSQTGACLIHDNTARITLFIAIKSS